MDIATSFMPLLQVFTAAMTEPTAESFRQLVAGWIFAPRRNIVGALLGRALCVGAFAKRSEAKVRHPRFDEALSQYQDECQVATQAPKED
jgi:hypothetical protein